MSIEALISRYTAIEERLQKEGRIARDTPLSAWADRMQTQDRALILPAGKDTLAFPRLVAPPKDGCDILTALESARYAMQRINIVGGSSLILFYNPIATRLRARNRTLKELIPSLRRRGNCMLVHSDHWDSSPPSSPNGSESDPSLGELLDD